LSKAVDYGMLTAFLCIALVEGLTKMAAFDTAVPTVDISPFTAPEAHSDAARRAVGQEWDAAMTNVGFAMIVGHGVDPGIVDALRRGAHSFFGGPADAKQKYCYGPYGNPLGGFTGMGVEAVARSRDDHGSDGGATQTTALPDLVESFVFKPEAAWKSTSDNIASMAWGARTLISTQARGDDETEAPVYG
jgi:isopenicillin N synthase-like dioxygenase